MLGVDPSTGGLDWKARLGIVLQSTGESGNVTVREQLTHFAGFYPNPRDVDEVIAAVGLEEQGRRRSSASSPAASAAEWMSRSASSAAPSCSSSTSRPPASTPRPAASSGSSSAQLKREGTTILLTTHYLDEAAQLGDRAGVIAGGKLIDIGPIDEIGGAEARVPIVRWREDGVLHEERTEHPGRLVADVTRLGRARRARGRPAEPRRHLPRTSSAPTSTSRRTGAGT